MRKLFMTSLLQFKNKASVQVIDLRWVTVIFHQISQFFRAFLSHKGLVSRRLREIQGLFEFAAGIAECELTQSRRGGEAQSERSGLFLAKVLRAGKAGGACTHMDRRVGVGIHTIKHNKTR
jgi:hypothetical protein